MFTAPGVTLGKLLILCAELGASRLKVLWLWLGVQLRAFTLADQVTRNWAAALSAMARAWKGREQNGSASQPPSRPELKNNFFFQVTVTF